MSTGAVKLSVATPVLTMFPQIGADWENDASIEDLAQIAQAADRLGCPTFIHTSLQDYLENLQPLAELHPPDGGPT